MKNELIEWLEKQISNCAELEGLEREQFAFKATLKKVRTFTDEVVEQPLTKFTVWLEGYASTGESSKSKCLGSYEAKTFVDACELAIKANKMSFDYYHKAENTYWGCKFYDNEIEAKQQFG